MPAAERIRRDPARRRGCGPGNACPAVPASSQCSEGRMRSAEISTGNASDNAACRDGDTVTSRSCSHRVDTCRQSHRRRRPRWPASDPARSAPADPPASRAPARTPSTRVSWLLGVRRHERRAGQPHQRLRCGLPGWPATTPGSDAARTRLAAVGDGSGRRGHADLALLDGDAHGVEVPNRTRRVSGR